MIDEIDKIHKIHKIDKIDNIDNIDNIDKIDKIDVEICSPLRCIGTDGPSTLGPEKAWG